MAQLRTEGGLRERIGSIVSGLEPALLGYNMALRPSVFPGDHASQDGEALI